MNDKHKSELESETTKPERCNGTEQPSCEGLDGIEEDYVDEPTEEDSGEEECWDEDMLEIDYLRQRDLEDLDRD